MMNIVLVGYMGSGKTSVSKALSHVLDREYIDLDFFIESSQNLSIQEIFSRYGEIKFRKIESLALREVLENNREIILSVGGGTPIFYDNMDLINEKSLSIYLQASPASLSQRLSVDRHNRPLIKHLSEEALPEFVAKHLFERSPYYQKAKLKVNANQTQKEVVEEILRSLP